MNETNNIPGAVVITHHCDECGLEIEDSCAEHPNARISSVSSRVVKLTTDTITDEQIRQLCDRAIQTGDLDLIVNCQAARGALGPGGEPARARCAEIWNTRRAKDGAA